MKPIYVILGPREHMPGGNKAHLKVVHCGKRRTPPGPQHQQGIPGTLEIMAKQKDGCSSEPCNTKPSSSTRL